ncbi:hypothetical protein LWC33_07645 [Pseudonocardia sp. RS11V-5]|uniref:hypothetical protein n=1 Tax=Pseudonocardia terrae TaxID=2905831 RepID=UPI001E37268A|nr:hypothetical protein [Pseudonocardia terrae]MCE3551324.1 hypothetical protein [Pseudonocardia terrae]
MTAAEPCEWSLAAERLLTDGSYRPDGSVLAELRLSCNDVEAVAAGVRPLGMTARAYLRFCEDLLHALDREGVTDADVRIQGSSVRFYAHAAKRMPFDEVAPHAVDRTRLWQVIDEGGRIPDEDVLDDATQHLDQVWPTADRPARRPFDALFRCAVHTDPSDYDVQVSSDQMIELVQQQMVRAGVDPGRITSTHPHYAFVRKRYAEEYFLYVTQWSARQSERLGRSVSWALFPSCGPQEAPDGDLSSHFRDSDWIIRRPGEDQGR